MTAEMVKLRLTVSLPAGKVCYEPNLENRGACPFMKTSSDEQMSVTMQCRYLDKWQQVTKNDYDGRGWYFDYTKLPECPTLRNRK